MDISRSSRVAVIDDDVGFSTSMAALLASDGFDVALFDSAESFMHAEAQNYCCLLIDWQLPGMSGAVLCRRLADDAGHPPMFLMSGTCFRDAGPPDGLASDVEFLEKPFDPEWLLAELADLCER